jgi:hypothetical protein
MHCKVLIDQHKFEGKVSFYDGTDEDGIISIDSTTYRYRDVPLPRAGIYQGMGDSDSATMVCFRHH